MIRLITPSAVKSDTPIIPTTADVENTAIPGPSPIAGLEPGDQPPPYEPPATATTTPTPLEPATPPKKRSSAERFTMGTSLFILLLFSLIIIGLDIQALIYCLFPNPVHVALQTFYWVYFAGICLWATTSAACWLMLLRNLWGPKVAKRWPIRQDWAYMWIFGMGALVVMPLWGLWKGLTTAVEMCQGRFCGEGLEDEVELELEEGRRLVGSDGDDGAEDVNGEGSSIRMEVETERESSKQGL